VISQLKDFTFSWILSQALLMTVSLHSVISEEFLKFDNLFEILIYTLDIDT
jgi:hypothetical protein